MNDMQKKKCANRFVPSENCMFRFIILKSPMSGKCFLNLRKSLPIEPSMTSLSSKIGFVE